MEFRKLKKEEIECRIQSINSKGLILLLYKDARVDQRLLDETVGAMNWQRKHSRDNANCEVGIWDSTKEQWIWKEDTGTESNTEAQKGLASDSFKRACFNWGIGRELYTAPLIRVEAGNYTLTEKGKCYDHFTVTEISYNEEGDIGTLEIQNDKLKRVVYKTGKRITGTPTEQSKKKAPKSTRDELMENILNAADVKNIPEEELLVKCKVKSLDELTDEQLQKTYDWLGAK